VTARRQAQLREVKRLSDQAEALRQAGKLAEAVAALEKILALDRELFGNVHEEVADALEQLADLHLEREAFGPARTARQERLEIRKKLSGEKHYTVTDARLNLADVDLQARLGREQRGRLREARALIERVVELYRQGKLGEALPLARRSVALCHQLLGDGHQDTAEALNNLGGLLQSQGNYAEARRCYEQALAVVQRVFGTDHPNTAKDLNNLGRLLHDLGDYTAARPYLEQALAVFRRVLGEGDPNTALALNNLGGLLQDQGDYAAARTYFERALTLLRRVRGEGHPETARALHNLGYALYVQGDYTAARPYLEQALAVFRKTVGDNHPDTARAQNTLGFLLYAQKDYAAARQSVEQALAVSRRVLGENHPQVAESLNFLGFVLWAQRDEAAARRCLEQAVAINQRVLGEEHPRTAVARNNLSFLHYAQGDFAGAQRLFQQAAALDRKVFGDRNPELAIALGNLGLTLFFQRDYAGARKNLEEALTLRLKAAESLLGTLSEAEGLAYVEAVRSGRDPLLFVARHLPGFTTAEVYAWVWATRALASRAVAGRRNLVEHVPAARPLWDQLLATRKQLAQLTLAAVPPDKARAREQRVARLSEDKERLERELARMSTAFRRQQEAQRVGFAELLARLPPGTAVVDLVSTTFQEASIKRQGDVEGARHYEAFVLRKSDRPPGYSVAWVHLGPGRPIHQAVREWRQSLVRATAPPADTEAPARDLRRLAWEPLEPHLAGCQTVVIIPDLAFTRVPWAALPGKKPGTHLLDDYAIATAPNGQQLYDLLTREPLRGDQLLVVGGVRYDEAPAQPANPALVAARRGPLPGAGKALRWPNLEGSLKEANQIAALWPESGRGVVLKGTEATAAALREALPQARYVHLATHGFFADPAARSVFQQNGASEPLLAGGFAMAGRRAAPVGRNPLIFSGIVLAGANRPPAQNEWGVPVGDDGILTVEEVAALDLGGTELVVLSGCETGLGDVAGGEGVFGLQRAFGLAGARTVIASLWKLDDEATQTLMVEFYRNLRERKLSKLEALRQAQRTMIGRYDQQRGKLRGPEEVPVDPKALEAARQRDGALPAFYWAGFVLSGDWR
jgi:CHAT domain-containing protein/Tfp pilus assembly protein PilF